MVTERPNAGVFRHQDRCGDIRRPRNGAFVPIAALGTAPIDVTDASADIGRPAHVKLKAKIRRVPT